MIACVIPQLGQFNFLKMVAGFVYITVIAVKSAFYVIWSAFKWLKANLFVLYISWNMEKSYLR